MPQLRMERCELTYEGAFSKAVFSLVDSPGKVCDLLLGALEEFGCTGADLELEEGEPDERGVSCNLDELDTRVTIYGDRVEVHCANITNGNLARVSAVLAEVWSGLAALSPGATAKTHSFLFEADTGISGVSYQEVLNLLAPAPQSLPPGTETAVVYYLPAELAKGHWDSSLVLNRSAGIEGGLHVNATLVYEAESVNSGSALCAARSRLGELLRNLGLQWTED